MAVGKAANSTARRIFRMCQSGERLDEAKLAYMEKNLPRKSSLVKQKLEAQDALDVAGRGYVLEKALTK